MRCGAVSYIYLTAESIDEKDRDAVRIRIHKAQWRKLQFIPKASEETASVDVRIAFSLHKKRRILLTHKIVILLFYYYKQKGKKVMGTRVIPLKV